VTVPDLLQVSERGFEGRFPITVRGVGCAAIEATYGSTTATRMVVTGYNGDPMSVVR
jgi:hypothetical protein